MSAGKQTRRVHPLTPFIRGWLILVAIVFAFSRQMIEQVNTDGVFDRRDLRLVPAGDRRGRGDRRGSRPRQLVLHPLRHRRRRAADRDRRALQAARRRFPSPVCSRSTSSSRWQRAVRPGRVAAGSRRGRQRHQAALPQSSAKASRLRDYLLTRAHGTQARIADASGQAPASRFTDLGRSDRPIVRVGPPAPAR